MKIFHLYRRHDLNLPVYDSMWGCTVIAETPDLAREIAANYCGDEGPAVWRTAATCDEIGTANLGAVPTLICRNFNAG